MLERGSADVSHRRLEPATANRTDSGGSSAKLDADTAGDGVATGPGAPCHARVVRSSGLLVPRLNERWDPLDDPNMPLFRDEPERVVVLFVDVA